jgi:hypothetical protein
MRFWRESLVGLTAEAYGTAVVLLRFYPDCELRLMHANPRFSIFQ